MRVTILCILWNIFVKCIAHITLNTMFVNKVTALPTSVIVTMAIMGYRFGSAVRMAKQLHGFCFLLSCSENSFGSQHPCQVVQLPVAPASSYLTTTSGLQGYIHVYTHTHTHPHTPTPHLKSPATLFSPNKII